MSSLSWFIGLILVIGIVAKNGILMLDADQKFRREGMSAEEAMLAAGGIAASMLLSLLVIPAIHYLITRQ